MDPWIWLSLAALVAGLLMIVSVARGFFSSKSKSNKPLETTDNPPAAVRPPGQRAEMAGGMRRARNVRSRVAAAQRARQAPAVLEEPAVNDLDTDDEDTGTGGFAEEEDETLKAFSNKKIGTKKLRKLQEKAEKKAQREQEQAMREDKKKREAKKEEERQRELEEERIREIKEEEEQRRLREEQERKEHEEYLKLKESFVVEEEGEAAEEDEEAKTVREFIEYIKRHKVVYMEDLAAEFNMKTQEAISRVHSLQESGELSGVVDDRGKFIYISEEELQAVTNFIKQRGRVSIVELVSSSNRLINLQPEQTTPSTVTI